MTGVRIFFFVLAAVAMVLIVAFELSTMAFLRNAAGTGESAPGLGGPYLALLDGILLYSVIRMGVDQLRIRKLRLKSVIARIFAVLTLIASFFGAFGAFLLILFAFFAIVSMVGLLLAAPFGTIAYFAAFADFPKTTAVAALSFIIVLKVFFLVMLALADRGYLNNKGLLTMVGLSLLATWLTSFLIAMPPGFLASITDAVGALITAIIAFVMLILIFITSIIAIARAMGVRSPGREV